MPNDENATNTLTQLFAAIKQGNTKLIQELDINGKSLDQEHSNGRTALTEAAFYGDDAVIKTLCTKGANVNKAIWLSGESPAYIAAKNGHSLAITALHQAGADMDKKDNTDRTPLHVAVENGHLKAVEALLEAGANALGVYWFCRTPLDWAKKNTQPAHKEIVELLKIHLKQYPEGKKTQPSERTPLCLYKPVLYSPGNTDTELTTLSKTLTSSKLKNA